MQLIANGFPSCHFLQDNISLQEGTGIADVAHRGHAKQTSERCRRMVFDQFFLNAFDIPANELHWPEFSLEDTFTAEGSVGNGPLDYHVASSQVVINSVKDPEEEEGKESKKEEGDERERHQWDSVMETKCIIDNNDLCTHLGQLVAQMLDVMSKDTPKKRTAAGDMVIPFTAEKGMTM